MDKTSHSSDSWSLTSEQIQALVESIQDALGDGFTRAEFVNHLLLMLEDIPGFETGDVPASLIETAWTAYSRGSSSSTSNQTARPLFSLGQVVATRAVHAHLEANHITPSTFLDRHVSGDWGNVAAEDAKTNALAVEHGARIMSSYDIAGRCVWIITEADRRVTTLLFPEEY
jgi:hypothetical protein